MISESVDILTIAETKIDDTFPTSQFLIEGFMKPFRFDRNRNGGGLLIYVRERAPVKQLTYYQAPHNIECGVIEINLKKQKWLLLAIYRPPSQSEQYFFAEIGKMLDHYCRKYENLVLIGDFNSEIDEDAIGTFIENYNLASLVRSPTCFKSDSPRCIDLILTNRRKNFQSTVTIETGLSDFHVMIVTLLKGGYVKRGPKIVTYRDYRKFSAVDFKNQLLYMLSPELSENEDYGAFEAVVMGVLNEHAPVKKKYIRANDGPFMTKALRKEHMHRTKLRNKYNGSRTEENLKAFKKQRNKCVKLLRRVKFDYYKNIDLNNLTDNHKFWKTVKPLFSDKVQVNSSISLIEDGKMVTQDSEIEEIFNHYFSNITDSLGISENDTFLLPTNDILDPIDKAIKKFEAHPSICKIKEQAKFSNKFEFREVTVEEVAVKIQQLNPSKASPVDCIPAKILKESCDVFSAAIRNLFNSGLSKGIFPKELKAGDISSLFKKEDTFSKKNYRPITVLPSVSKIYERLMQDQMLPFTQCFLSPLLCGFREGYGTQHALLRLVETCKKSLDNGGVAGAVLTDLSKAFDCLNHELLIAKLNAYGFSRSALQFIHSFLVDRKQRVKVNGSFSTWTKTILGVPQGSVLGPLLFNIYLNDLFMFLEETEVCNYADDTTIYAYGPKIDNVIAHLENDALKLTEWFPNNLMKLNEDKCHLMIFGAKDNEVSVKIGGACLKESTEENLLGIKFDRSFSFKEHVKTLCKKASQKLHALNRISCYMDTEKLQQLMRAFILSHFSYCPLVWMFCDRTINQRINHIHERALRIAQKDYEHDFGFLLEQTNSVPIHIRNLQLLMTEIFKTKIYLNPTFMKDIFTQRNTGYELRHGTDAQVPKVRTTSFGIETIAFLGNRMWQLLPHEIKDSSTLPIFKKQIRCWNGDKCNCRLCKVYVQQVGFITG